MMVETEHTPNPDTLKFLPGKKVSEVGPIEFLKSDKNIKVSLATKILSLEGTLILLSFFKNSIGPTSETFFPGKNFSVLGLGVCSVSTIIDGFYYSKLYLSSELCKTNYLINFFKIIFCY